MHSSHKRLSANQTDAVASNLLPHCANPATCTCLQPSSGGRTSRHSASTSAAPLVRLLLRGDGVGLGA